MEQTQIVLEQTGVPDGKFKLKYTVPRQSKPPLTKWTNYMNYCPSANLVRAEIKGAYWDHIKVDVGVTKTNTTATNCVYVMKARKAIPNWIVGVS